MAEIFVFRARPRSEGDVGAQRAESAKILFFTGVRYMRWEQDGDAPEAMTPKTARRNAKSTPPRRRSRKRA